MELRLPTEAEWEYACRAGSTGPYCFDSPYVGELLDYAWFNENSGETKHPVGQKKPNAWGIHDMHGNVNELCQDWYGDYPNGPMTDPVGPKNGYSRVVRGGCWYGFAEDCRSASRNWYCPGLRADFLGFRVAVSSTP
jgi:formylglycine-generating enzyme required for sulfatase activity